jgi:hypothetical protein
MEKPELDSPSITTVGFGQGFLGKNNNVTTLEHPPHTFLTLLQLTITCSPD